MQKIRPLNNVISNIPIELIHFAVLSDTRYILKLNSSKEVIIIFPLKSPSKLLKSEFIATANIL